MITARKWKNFRKKADDDDEEEEVVVVRPASAAAGGKRRVAKPMSFDAGEADAAVQLKRSKASVAMQQGDTAALDKRMRVQASMQDATSLIAGAPTMESSRPKYDLESLRTARGNRAPARRVVEEDSGIPTDAEIFTLADQDVDDADAEDEFIPLDVRSKYNALKLAKDKRKEVLTSSVMDEENFDPLKSSNRRQEITKALNDFGDQDFRHQTVDDEDDEWQSEQIRRATAHSVRYDKQAVAAATRGDSNIKALSSTLELIDLNAFTATMNETITALRSQASEADRNLTTLRNDLALTNAEIEKLRATAQQEAQSFEWLQIMREYCSDLVGCLRAKQPLINDLQEATFALLRGSLQKRREWRTNQQEDMLVALKQEGRLMALGDYQPVAVLKEADKPATVEVDEYGRERSTADLYMSQVEHRNQIRSRRLQKRQQLVAESEPSLADAAMGQTEWELSDTEAQAFDDRCNKLAQASNLVFRDTADEYRDIQHILRRFAEFRGKYPSKYQTAYISTSLVEVLGVHVQLDLLPQIATLMLKSGVNEFDLQARPWFRPVEQYCEEGESDNRLMSNIVSDVIFPLLRKVVPQSFDPRSRKSNTAVAALMNAMRNQHPRVDAMADVVQLVAKAFEEEIRRLCIPVLTTSVRADVNTLLAMRRQVTAAAKLASNLCLWQGFFTPAHINHLLWQLLFHRTKGALLKLLTITSNLYDVVESSILQYVLGGVRAYLVNILEASDIFGNPASQELVNKIRHVLNEVRQLQPADAARRLSSVFV